MNNAPLRSPIANSDGAVTQSWQTWFSEAARVLLANVESGTTANRPTKFLWIGRRYYDTTLGKPVYVASVGPVVWKDASGSTV